MITLLNDGCLQCNSQTCITNRLCKARSASPSPLLTLRRSPSCLIRSLAWHPHMNQWAVALRDDTIALYNLRHASDNTVTGQFDTLILSNQYMTGVRTMMVSYHSITFVIQSTSHCRC
jgi:hypothetical protein